MDWKPEFDRCSEYIAAALVYADGTHELCDVEAAITAGKAQFWPGCKSAVVTEILTYPRKQVCHFWLAGGDLEELVHMEHSISIWAKAMGCSGTSIAGRAGWLKALPDYRKMAVTLAKELT